MLAVLIFVIQLRVSDSTHATNEVVDKASPAVEMSLKLEREIHHALSMHRGYMILGLDEMDEARLQAWERIAGYTSELDKLAAEWTDAKVLADYDEFKRLMSAFQVAQQRIIDIAHTDADQPANTQYFGVAAPFGREMIESLQSILDEELVLEANEERKLLVRRIAEVEVHLLKSQNAISTFLVTGSESDREEIQACLAACQASVDRLMTMKYLFTDSQQSLFDGYIAAHTRFLKEATMAVDIRSAPGFCVSEDLCMNTVTPLANQAIELMGSIEHAEQIIRDEAVEQIHASSATMVSTVWVVGIATLVCSALIAYFLSNSITRRLRLVMDYAGRIAGNDLSMPDLELKSKDEIGKLAETVSNMKNALKQVILEVTSSTEAVASASGEVAASAEEMAAGLQEQENQTQQVAAAVEELSQSVSEVANKSSEATSASVESQRLAEDGGVVVRSTVSEMEGIATDVNETARTVNSLGTQSQKIGDIIAVINDIADQTNLLALNAAIEAARAGEHGRGFAVVADEVRKLAERTTQATEEVSTSIRSIQGETGSAVGQIESSSQRVGRGVELASKAGESLEIIVGSSKSVQRMVQDIAAAANQQATASDEIARAIESISGVTRQSSAGAGQASQAAADLAHQSEHLMALVGKFKTD